jgi:CHAD domain-containing protein
MNPCDPDFTVRDFGLAKTASLLDDAAAAIQRASDAPDIEAVHKMRVAIRRFQQALRLFSQFLRKRGVRRVRRQLKELMDPAGELRNHDIAIGLMRRAKLDSASLKEKRLAARADFVEAVRLVARQDLADRWRKALELPGA